jgi:hypothetical protein
MGNGDEAGTVKFSAKQVSQLVSQELIHCAEFSSWHGITAENLEKHRVSPPCSRRFKESFQDGCLWLWVILDELPQSKDGYLIVYDPRRNLFGLATKSDGKSDGTFIGYYGNLRETLEGM